MRSIEIQRRQIHRLVGQKAGQDYDFPRTWAGQQRMTNHLADVFALPVDVDSVVDLNTADGSLVFVPGISDPGGTDVIT
jgi:hypothetical protein